MKGWPGEPDMDYDVLVADGEAAANAGKPITDVIFDFGNVLILLGSGRRAHPPLQPEGTIDDSSTTTSPASTMSTT